MVCTGMDPITVPIEDVLDLHLFRPAEVPDLLDNYFQECIQAKIFTVRVIHGKGKGILKKGVLALLEKHPLVRSLAPAPPEAGGWGATLVTLHQETVSPT